MSMPKRSSRQRANSAARHLAVEQLEAALRVVDAGHRQRADPQVAGAAEQHPQSRLRARHVRRRHGARAGGDLVAFVERARERLQLLDRRRQIRVHQQHARAARRRHAGAQRRALAAVARQRYQAHRSVAVRADVALHDRWRLVARAVVGDHDLPALAPPVQVADRTLEGALDAGRFVVRRDHDGEAESRGCRRRGRHLQSGRGHCVVPHFPGVVYSPQSTNRNAV